MKRMLTLVFLCLAIQANTRDWGFSKDTVFEWSPGGDNVSLTNSASEVRIDTGILEVLKPSNLDTATLIFAAGSSDFGVIFRKNIPGYKTVFYFRSLYVNSGSSIFQNFRVDWPLAIPSKRAASIGDTILSRLILIGDSTRGRDTLMVKGIWAGRPVSLRSQKQGNSQSSMFLPMKRALGRVRDVLGRSLRGTSKP